MAENTSNEVRLAVGPFFTPTANDDLRATTVALPALLAVELSREKRFQIVEREKVEAVCRELNLTAHGLVTQNSVSKLGQMLACDWFVSGTLIPCGSQTVVWTKVIDVHKGIIVDIGAQTLKLSDLSSTAKDISAFVRNTKYDAKGRQFVALGPISDMSPQLSFKRDDWPRRISALIEKHYHEAGFGVVEMAAVMPILEERRLQAAGFTDDPKQRVGLQAAFWFVDGGCEWVRNSMTRLNIELRVQRVGDSEQMFHLKDLSTEEVETSVLKTLENAFSRTNQLNLADAAKAEVELLTKRGMEGATRNSPFRPKVYGNVDQSHLGGFIFDVEHRKRWMEDRRATLAGYERLLLQDPGNFDAKHMLGYGLLYDPDPAARKRGKELLLQNMNVKKNSNYTAHVEQTIKMADLQPPDPAEEFYSGELSTDLDALERMVEENPDDLRAKYNLGALLLHSNADADQDRGAKLLREIIAADDNRLAERAKKVLPLLGTHKSTAYFY